MLNVFIFLALRVILSTPNPVIPNFTEHESSNKNINLIANNTYCVNSYLAVPFYYINFIYFIQKNVNLFYNSFNLKRT